MAGAEYRIVDVNPAMGLEVSWVPRGSNPLSKVVLKKQHPSTLLEIPNMALKSVALAALMSTAVGAALAKSFDKEEQLDAFLAKDDAGQTAELATFAKAKGMPFGEPDEDDKAAAKKAADEKAAAEKAALEKGDIATLVAQAVAKAVEPLQADLKKSQEQVAALSGGVVKATLEKRAETEYKGLGKGLAKTVSILKAIDGIEDAEARTEIENILKAHAEMTAKLAKSVGYDTLEKTEGSAVARLNKAVIEYATKNKVSKEEAEVLVQSDAAYADLMDEVDAEEQQLRAA